MSRWAAPVDTSSITLSTGTLAVTDGHVEVPEEATAGDLVGLAANGFTLAQASGPAADNLEVATEAHGDASALAEAALPTAKD